MNHLGHWDRNVWGVETVDSRGERHLLGVTWDEGELERHRAGQIRTSGPTRALLFCTRAQARAWCRQRNARWREHNDPTVKVWRARPVRVRETVKVVP